MDVLSALAIARTARTPGGGVIARQSARIRSLADQVLGFQTEIAKTAQLFIWSSTRQDLNALLDRPRSERQILTGRLTELA